MNTLSRFNLTSKDLYLSGPSDDYVNRGLARLFVRYCVEKRGRTKTNFGNAIHYLQRVLDDSLDRANKVAKRGSIKDDRFLTKFKKDMLIQVPILIPANALSAHQRVWRGRKSRLNKES
jgi:hypothetical protein